ncbi:hypothetical protein Cob_v006594 [Colletotrichum orbiculare MAFF 240422]|uniref:Uncharacterized protein n=1 Tax=Colletotrichum orbiculare (strain 104-T / ATCC 96160 / CBS 514.97 / LARS 414 / MAFF 240422) TaxID=1213857 RepID=A0A484FQZ8_COLOR|nr:hypothetical protein Cob_v006594 [Colletotrichum orbiculare MAFF 240422]
MTRFNGSLSSPLEFVAFLSSCPDCALDMAALHSSPARPNQGLIPVSTWRRFRSGDQYWSAPVCRELFEKLFLSPITPR